MNNTNYQMSAMNQFHNDFDISSRKIEGLNILERKAIKIQELQDSVEYSRDNMINMVVDLENYMSKDATSRRHQHSPNDLLESKGPTRLSRRS